MRRKRLVVSGVVLLILMVPGYFFVSACLIAVRMASMRTPIPLLHIMGMRIRGTPVEEIARNYAAARRAGVEVTIVQLEEHVIAGGNVTEVVRALVEAKSAAIPLSVEMATAIDLAAKSPDRGILHAVRTMGSPVALGIPPERYPRNYLQVPTLDGVLLHFTGTVTVRTCLPRYIGGASEETLLARVGEKLTQLIGATRDHMTVLANPSSISVAALRANMDAGTAFEILSIDIAVWKASSPLRDAKGNSALKAPLTRSAPASQ